MPNHLQFLFLASFLAVLVTLVALSRLLQSKLRAAGYDISEIILLGLPKTTTPDAQGLDMASAQDLLNLQDNKVAQVVALALAVASSAFIYLKFGRSRESTP